MFVWGVLGGVFSASWYCSHNHRNLCSGIVIRWRPSISYMCDTPCWFWMMFCVHLISLSGLLSPIWMWHRGMIWGGGMYLKSLVCFSWKFNCRMLVKCWFCLCVPYNTLSTTWYYGLWCFGCSTGTSLFWGAICYILFYLGVFIYIGRMCMFLLLCFLYL